MDSLTAANSLATIIQLVGMFKQEQKDGKNADHQEFVEWLQYHRHEDIKNLICNTAAIQSEVNSLLRQDTATILSRMEMVHSTLAALVSRIDGFQGLSKSLMPDAELSEQAVSTLRQLFESNSTNFLFQEFQGGAVFQAEAGEPFTYTDLRFLADDIDTLERCGFIIQRPGGDTYIKIYGITRAGARFIEVIDQKKEP